MSRGRGRKWDWGESYLEMDWCRWRQDLLQVGLWLGRNHKAFCQKDFRSILCQAMELFLPCSHGSLDGRWHAQVCVCYLDILDSRRASRVWRHELVLLQISIENDRICKAQLNGQSDVGKNFMEFPDLPCIAGNTWESLSSVLLIPHMTAFLCQDFAVQPLSFEA